MSKSRLERKLTARERRIMDRYCANLRKQGDDKAGLRPLDPQDVVEAIDKIIGGARTLDAINEATVALLALGSAGSSAGGAAANCQALARMILEFQPTLDRLKDCSKGASAATVRRGKRANPALRSMISGLADIWEQQHNISEPVTPSYDNYDEAVPTKCEAADYIGDVCEAYFEPNDERLMPLKFEVICNQLKERRARFRLSSKA